MTNLQRTTRILITTIAVAALALVLPAAPPVQAGGLINCVDVTGSAFGRVGCYEMVWVDGNQLRMTFANQGFTGATPSGNLDNFYVIAPQTETPQGPMPSFPHDHVVANVPRQNHGAYSVHLHGYFVLCSAQGIASGACVPTWISSQGMGTLPFAKTVNGQMLTSAELIESAVDSGLLALVDTGAVIVATINPGK